MHFVLWGLHQLISGNQYTGDRSFNALRALGSSSTFEFSPGSREVNVSMHFVLWGLHQLDLPGYGYREFSFNALRALGSSSTRMESRCNRHNTFQCTSCFGVFINFAQGSGSGGSQSFNALRALGSSSTYWHFGLEVVDYVSMHFVLWGLHQLGCLLFARASFVSMHFVLWGLHQPSSHHLDEVVSSFNALRALGSSST